MPVVIWILLLVIIPGTIFAAVILPMIRKRNEEQTRARTKSVDRSSSTTSNRVVQPVIARFWVLGLEDYNNESDRSI